MVKSLNHNITKMFGYLQQCTYGASFDSSSLRSCEIIFLFRVLYLFDWNSRCGIFRTIRFIIHKLYDKNSMNLPQVVPSRKIYIPRQKPQTDHRLFVAVRYLYNSTHYPNKGCICKTGMFVRRNVVIDMLMREYILLFILHL